MVWHTPKTDWTTGPLPAANLNEIGDDLQYLKDHVDTTTIHKTSSEIRGESATQLVIECRTSDPSTPANGKIWLRTDL